MSIRETTLQGLFFKNQHIMNKSFNPFNAICAITLTLANSGASDQTPQYAASGQGLHCFLESESQTFNKKGNVVELHWLEYL